MLRIRCAHNSRAVDPEDLKHMIANVARDIGKHTALELITKLQMTGYRICPTIQARSQDPPLAEEQRAIEACTQALDYAWAAQPPMPFPRNAEASARLRFRGLVEPCRLLYAKLAAGFQMTGAARCGRCPDCQAQDPSLTSTVDVLPLTERKALAERLLMACEESDSEMAM
jgi:hypothetical protein